MSFPIVAMVASTAMSVGSQLMAGAQRKAAAKGEARQYEMAAEETRIKTLQEEGIRRARFAELTGANIADVAARGVTSDSASYGAIMEANREGNEFDIRNRRYMGESQARRFDLTAANKRAEASSAMRGAIFGSVGTVIGAGFDAYRTMGGGGGGGGGGQASGSWGGMGGNPTADDWTPEWWESSYRRGTRRA